jgi:hypothetical protein
MRKVQSNMDSEQKFQGFIIGADEKGVSKYGYM